jgi:hypothetical protein
MVHQKTDHLLAGCGEQDVSPHGDRYKKTNGNDLRHDCRYHTPSRRKRSTLPTQCYTSSFTQRSATLVNNDSRDDDDSSFKDDTMDDDDSSFFKDDTSDDEPNYEDSKFDNVPLPIDDYVDDDSNNNIFSTKRMYKMKAERDFFSSLFPSFVVTTFSRLFRCNEV